MTKRDISVYTLDVNYEFDKDLGRSVKLQILVSYIPHNFGKSVQLVNINMNMCEFLTQSMSLPLMKMIMAELRKSSNIPYECPLKAVK